MHQKVLAYRAHVEGHLVRFFQEDSDPALGKRWGDRIAGGAFGANPTSDLWAKLAYERARDHAQEVLAARPLDADAKLVALNAQGYAALRYAEWSTVAQPERLQLLTSAERLLSEVVQGNAADYTALDNLALAHLALALTNPGPHLGRAFTLASRSRLLRPGDFFAPWLLSNVSLRRGIAAQGSDRDVLLESAVKDIDAALVLRPSSKFLKVAKAKALVLQDLLQTPPITDRHGAEASAILGSAQVPAASMATRNDYEARWCLVLIEAIRASSANTPNALSSARAQAAAFAHEAQHGPPLRSVQDISAAADQVATQPNLQDLLRRATVAVTLVQ
jgi:hypothetical protein